MTVFQTSILFLGLKEKQLYLSDADNVTITVTAINSLGQQSFPITINPVLKNPSEFHSILV